MIVHLYPLTSYQKDREKILYSKSFRRLSHKTQVFFTKDAGDHYRTRLTHTLEVAHLARILGHALGVNEDLCEAIALAHDLGHPPFGHAGERALASCMALNGGFDHNFQALRIVLFLEKEHPDRPGLNLTLETLEGILKHNFPCTFDDETLSFLEGKVPSFFLEKQFLQSPPSIEAQIASLSDDIAYGAHDIDDGLRAGFFTFEDLEEIPLIWDLLKEDFYKGGEIPSSYLLSKIITLMKTDILDQTMSNFSLKSKGDLRFLNEFLVAFSPQMENCQKILKDFLRLRMYEHPLILESVEKAHTILKSLFDAYLDTSFPFSEEGRERGICDFISGMTDRYALNEYENVSRET